MSSRGYFKQEQYELFCRKQHDYTSSNISVGTQLLTEDEIKLSLADCGLE